MLYINADEDRVSRQFNHVNGDLRTNEYERKINTIGPRLACVLRELKKKVRIVNELNW